MKLFYLTTILKREGEEIFPNHYKAHLLFGIVLTKLRNDEKSGAYHLRQSLVKRRGIIHKFIKKVLIPEDQSRVDVCALKTEFEKEFKISSKMLLKGRKINIGQLSTLIIETLEALFL